MAINTHTHGAYNTQRAILPPAFLTRMARLLGDEYGAFAASYDAAPGTSLRVNTLKLPVDAFRALAPFSLEPVPWAPEGFLVSEEPKPPATNLPLGKHPYHAAGLYYLQEPSAMAVARLLDARPGDRVLDLSAAPGGKATHLASLMGNEGLLVANEIHGKRVWALAENLERWGVRNAVVTNETPERLAERCEGFFDRVLLDAPCSGEGMFRKSEIARLEWTPELVQGCALRQSLILEQAARTVRPGGCLVYATCTFAPEEDEGVVAHFLRNRPDFEIVDPVRQPAFREGRPDWLTKDAVLPELRRAVRLWPHSGPGEGHFIAALRRNPVGTMQPIRHWRLEKIPRQVEQLYVEFCEDHLTVIPGQNRLALVGNYLYALPLGAPDLGGLRFIHPGWWLGTVKKSRFEPSHALALGLSLTETRPDRVVNLWADSQEVLAYLRGKTLPSTGDNGWTLIAVDGFPLGWGKRVGGILKSRYPKGLRWM